MKSYIVDFNDSKRFGYFLDCTYFKVDSVVTRLDVEIRYFKVYRIDRWSHVDSSFVQDTVLVSPLKKRKL